MVLIISLTDVSRCNRARQRGGGWLKCRVDRSDNSRPGARPRRRLVTRGSNHSRNSLGRCLIARGVHRRARGRSPRHVVAILDRLVCLRSIASGRRSRDDRGRGGEHRQDVERELHFCYEVVKDTGLSVYRTIKTVGWMALEQDVVDGLCTDVMNSGLAARMCTKTWRIFWTSL